MRTLFAALAGLTLAGAVTTTATAAVQTGLKPTPAVNVAAAPGFERVQYYDRRHYSRPRYNRGYRQGYRDAYRYNRYSNSNYRHYNRRYRDNDNDEVLAAIAGGVVGYALGSYGNNNNGYGYGYGQSYAAPPTYYAPRYCYDPYGRAYGC